MSLGKWRRHIRKGDLTNHVCIMSTTPYIIGESDIIDITTSTQNKLITCTCTSNKWWYDNGGHHYKRGWGDSRS
jgi:hypothetical protein